MGIIFVNCRVSMETSSNESADRFTEIPETDEMEVPLLGNTGI